MDEPIQPITLERHIRFDPRHPVAAPLATPLPGQLLLIGMRAGQHLRDHRVRMPITIQVLRGEGTITVAGVSYPARSGTLFPLPADAIHGVAAATDFVLLVYRAAAVAADADRDVAAPHAEGDCPTLDMRALVPGSGTRASSPRSPPSRPAARSASSTTTTRNRSGTSSRPSTRARRRGRPNGKGRRSG